MSNRLFRFTALAVLTAVTATGAAAQGRTFEIVPFVGGYIPSTTLGSIRIPGLGGAPTTITGEMKTAPMFGGRLAVSGEGRLGAEATYFLAASDMRIALGPFSQSFDGQVQGGSAKLTYRATSEGSGTDLTLGAGVGGIHHGGEAFQLASGQFDVGGVVGAGLRILLTPQVTLRFDGEAIIYPWSAGSPLGSKTQTDLMMTAGLAIKMGR